MDLQLKVSVTDDMPPVKRLTYVYSKPEKGNGDHSQHLNILVIT